MGEATRRIPQPIQQRSPARRWVNESQPKRISGRHSEAWRRLRPLQPTPSAIGLRPFTSRISLVVGAVTRKHPLPPGSQRWPGWVRCPARPRGDRWSPTRVRRVVNAPRPPTVHKNANDPADVTDHRQQPSRRDASGPGCCHSCSRDDLEQSRGYDQKAASPVTGSDANRARLSRSPWNFDGGPTGDRAASSLSV
jgi:hypothetical protein